MIAAPFWLTDAVTNGPASVLLVKLALSPLLIGLATVITARWGARVGGWFIALPLTSGPVVAVLALERGARFAAETCVGVLLGGVALAAFAAAYARSARFVAWPAATAVGCAAYLGATWLLRGVRVGPVAAFGAMGMAIAAALVLTPRAPHADATRRLAPWEIVLRMALAVALIVGITAAAARLGPRLSGLLTPFPIGATVLAVFTHATAGGAVAARFARGFLTGLPSFGAFFLVLALLLPTGALGASFLAATTAALLMQGALAATRRRVMRPGACEPGSDVRTAPGAVR